LFHKGLVFNLADGEAFHDSPDVHLQIRGLADGTLRFAKGDPVNIKVIPVYTNMLINRGRYLALFGQHERAIAAFEQALALNPDLALARQGLAESAAKARRP
jgi:tetratricopeptide (TPR) repeat protein